MITKIYNISEIVEMSFIEQITQLFENEFKTNILFILDRFGPLNLQTIHQLLKKSKSAILTHIKEMLNANWIEIDSEATAQQWGKYYKVTQYVKDLFKSNEPVVLTDEIIAELLLKITKEDLAKRIGNAQRSIGFQAYLLANLTAQYLENNPHFFENWRKHKEQLIGFSGSMYEIGLNSPEDYNEIKKIFNKFSEDLTKFEANEMNKSKNVLSVILLSSPTDKINPNNQQKI